MRFDRSRHLYYEPDDDNNCDEVCSIEGDTPAFVQFVNKTRRPVDIWWRNYEGQRYFYVRIGPSQHVNVDTFITHPWEFLDAITCERFVINNEKVFRPPPCIGNMRFRTHWNITAGVRTLRRAALIAVGSYMKNDNGVDTLGLPKVLVEEVKFAIRFMNQTYRLDLIEQVA
ncbi:von Hippel-Lindau tumor suppressor homolog [Eumeta japonica]|uniref:von Hippel-Lindau tumor suppressor homolog n=1 Tax=Eumeta variegata TaxID=151549 RepID=A0A4C1ZGD9_EUMVA|nr:von Hippel-Lindau tumor suppressor homolog [Eumeta japonica]